MTVDDAIKAFEKYGTDIFSRPRCFTSPCMTLLLNRSKYRQEVLDQAVESLINKFDPDPKGRIWSHDMFAAPEDRCKT